MKLGDKIKHLRKARKLSVRKLAVMTSTSKTTISEIENNIVTNPKYETIVTIAKALNVPAGFLMDDKQTMDDITDDLLKIAQFKGNLSETTKEEKMEMLRDIVKQEPSIIYETMQSGEFIGPLTQDEILALKAYLKIYRESKGRD